MHCPQACSVRLAAHRLLKVLTGKCQPVIYWQCIKMPGFDDWTFVHTRGWVTASIQPLLHTPYISRFVYALYAAYVSRCPEIQQQVRSIGLNLQHAVLIRYLNESLKTMIGGTLLAPVMRSTLSLPLSRRSPLLYTTWGSAGGMFLCRHVAACGPCSAHREGQCQEGNILQAADNVHFSADINVHLAFSTILGPWRDTALMYMHDEAVLR